MNFLSKTRGNISVQFNYSIKPIYIITNQYLHCKEAEKRKKIILVTCLFFTIITTIHCTVGIYINQDTTSPEIIIINLVEGYFYFLGIQLIETLLDFIGEKPWVLGDSAFALYKQQ